jgi:hypothetical protein
MAHAPFYKNLYPFLVFMLVNGWVFAESNMPPVVVSGLVGGSSIAVPLVDGTDISNAQLVGEYQVSVDVRYKDERRRTIVKQLPLKWGKEESKDTEFFFKGREGEIQLDLVPNILNPKRHTSITDYEELWIDYRMLIPNNPNSLYVDIGAQEWGSNLSEQREVDWTRNLVGIVNESAKDILDESSDRGRYEIDPIFRIAEYMLKQEDNVESTSWIPKDRQYLIHRTISKYSLMAAVRDKIFHLFNLNSVFSWRYSQDDGDVVLQKLFTQELVDIVNLEVVVKANSSLERINLRLKSDKTQERLITWPNLFKHIETDKFGQQIVTLLISETLQHWMPDHEEVILTEMVIKLKGQSQHIVRDRPIKELRWLRWDKARIQDMIRLTTILEASKGISKATATDEQVLLAENVDLVSLKKEEVLLDDGITRLKINLIDLRQWLDADRRIVPARLWIGRQDKERPSGLRLENIELVSFSDKLQPAVAFWGRRQ